MRFVWLKLLDLIATLQVCSFSHINFQRSALRKGSTVFGQSLQFLCVVDDNWAVHVGTTWFTASEQMTRQQFAVPLFVKLHSIITAHIRVSKPLQENSVIA